MKALRSLDAHAHLDPVRTSDELVSSGAVLAMTISLDEAALVVDRHEPQIVWGIARALHEQAPQAKALLEEIRKKIKKT